MEKGSVSYASLFYIQFQLYQICVPFDSLFDAPRRDAYIALRDGGV